MPLLEISLAVLIVLLAFYFTQWVKHRGKRSPPGPLGLPVVGHLPFLSPTHPHHSLTNLSRKFGSIYSIQLGSISTVVLSDVKLVRQALALDALSGRAPLYLTHGIMKGNGIICVQGRKWREQRKFVMGCLRNLGMVKFGEKRSKMETDIKTGVAQLIHKLEDTGGEPTETGHLLMHSLGNVVFNLVFGKMWQEGDETWEALINLQEEGTKLIGIAGPINFLPFLRFLPKYKKIIKYIENGILYSHNIYQNILEDYRTTCGKDLKEENAPHFLGCFNREMLKRENEESFYTPQQFNYLMADLWGAGVDTTMTTLRWFLLYIAHHTDCQKNIQREMDEVLNGREISLDDVQFLPYFQASMSEAQRIRSVTPLGIPHGSLEGRNLYFSAFLRRPVLLLSFKPPLPRVSNTVQKMLTNLNKHGKEICRSYFKDDILSYFQVMPASDCTLNGYFIPKGTMIVPLQWAIHMNPKDFPDPDAYDPNRFLTEDGKFAKPDAFIPFQTGKRMCLGEEYARMLLFLYAGTVLQKFHLSLEKPPDFDGEVGITLTPKAHKIKFIPRTSQ